jgi:RHS repeat-associated protein
VTEGASTLARFQYDAEGRLLKKIGEEGIRQYVYDQTSRLAEYDNLGAAVARFNYGSDRLISMWHQGEGTRFYHLDGLRSVTALTDTTGAVTANLRLDAWGNFRFPADLTATANRFAFTGHVFDTETGLYYAKARYFDPKLGRFLTQDSFLGEIDEPPSLHRYLYANANPTRYLDLTGNAGIEAKDVANFAAAAGYTFLYDIVPGAEFVGGRPEEFAEYLGGRGAFAGAQLGHAAAINTGAMETAAGLLAISGATTGGTGAAAAALVPGGQVVTAVGVPAAAVVAVAGAVSTGIGVYTMSKAHEGMERLREREASIVKESKRGQGKASPPGEDAQAAAKPTTDQAVKKPSVTEPPASGVYEVRGELGGKKKKYAGSGRDMDVRLSDSRHPARELMDKGENVTVKKKPVDVSDAPTTRETDRILRTNEQLSLDEMASEPGESLNKIRARAPQKFERDLPKYGDRRQPPQVEVSPKKPESQPTPRKPEEQP